MEEASLQQESASVVGVSVASLDVDYKALMKGPMRLLEVLYVDRSIAFKRCASVLVAV